MRTSALITLTLSLIQVHTFRFEQPESDKNDNDSDILQQLLHKNAAMILHEMTNSLYARETHKTWTPIERRLYVAASEKFQTQMADGLEPGYPEWRDQGLIKPVKIDKSANILNQAVYLMVVGDLLLNLSKNRTEAAKAYKEALELLKNVTGEEGEEGEVKGYETMIQKKAAYLEDSSIVLANPFLDRINLHLKNGDYKLILQEISQKISDRSTTLTWKLRDIYIDTSQKLRMAIAEKKEPVPRSWQDVLPNIELSMNAQDSKLVDQAVYLILVGDFLPMTGEQGDPLVFYTEASNMLDLVRDIIERPYVKRYRAMIKSRIQPPIRGKDIPAR